MDIYSYLNSPDVAEHCRKLNYQFNALETAFIINDCRRISIEEKHRLYREIMDTMPDMEIPNPRVFHEKAPDLSLFHQLEILMEQEDRILRRLKEGRDGRFYTYHIADCCSGYVSDCLGFFPLMKSCWMPSECVWMMMRTAFLSFQRRCGHWIPTA